MATVLLTGASGLVGTWLRRTIPSRVDLVAWTHRTPIPDSNTLHGDLRDRDVVAHVVDLRPTLIIHAAVALDEASIVDATRNVVDAASAVGAHLVHLSTDAVFSGDGGRRDENDAPDPVSDYGRWKAAAEDVVTSKAPTSAIVRLPLVVSVDPEDGATRRIRQGETRWFEDEVRQPAMAADLATAIWDIAPLGDNGRGAWHLPGPERLSRYEIAERVVAALHLDRSSIVAVPTPPDSRRPKDLHLGDDRARREIGWRPRPILR